jgi:hypothetical protein
VFGRVERGEYVFDFRTIRRDEIPVIAAALLSAECEKNAHGHVLVGLLDRGRRLVPEASPGARLIQELRRLGRGAAYVGYAELVRIRWKVHLCHFNLRPDIARRRPNVNSGTAPADCQTRRVTTLRQRLMIVGSAGAQMSEAVEQGRLAGQRVFGDSRCAASVAAS